MSGLGGARVLCTRTAVDNAPFAALLESRGAAPVLFPCIEFAPPEAAAAAALDDALRTLADPRARPHLVAFASPHAAAAFCARLAALQIPLAALDEVRVAAVGAGTADALAALGLRASIVPRTSVGAEALAEALLPLVHGARVLLPRADGGNPALAQRLQQAGALVTSVVLYRTVPVAAPDPRGLAALRSGAVDAVAFASGSAARAFSALLGDEGPRLAARAVVACMGERCASDARAAGLPVHAVADGGLAELLDSLDAALSLRARDGAPAR